MLQRIHTWVPDPVLGDMNYEHEFTNDSATWTPAAACGFRPCWHHHEGWDDNYQAQSVNAGHNAFGGDVQGGHARISAAMPSPCPSRSGRRRFRSASTRSSSPTASTCSAARRTTAWPSSSRITSRSSKRRSTRRAVSRSSRKSSKLVPSKPIRFLVNTHQHHDHIGGLRTYMHIGATIITHWKNYDFYTRDVLNYAPRTLQPDMMALWPPTEVAEGYQYESIRENYALTDGARNDAHLATCSRCAARGRDADGVSAGRRRS